MLTDMSMLFFLAWSRNSLSCPRESDSSNIRYLNEGTKRFRVSGEIEKRLKALAETASIPT